MVVARGLPRPSVVVAVEKETIGQRLAANLPSAVQARGRRRDSRKTQASVVVGMAGWSRLVGVLVGSAWVGSACRVVLAGEVATPWQRSGEGLEGEFD